MKHPRRCQLACVRRAVTAIRGFLWLQGLKEGKEGIKH